MDVLADTKDWTWVLERPCPDCGLDTTVLTGPEVPAMLRRQAARWQRLLGAGGPLAVRPRPDVWSPLEYGARVRDVLGLAERRERLLLEQEHPVFANWDQDLAAVEDRYGDQDPTTVAAELGRAVDALAELLEGLGAEQWARDGRRSDGSLFTVASFARYVLHDVTHHLADVGEPAAL